jgi:hypothetical protein
LKQALKEGNVGLVEMIVERLAADNVPREYRVEALLYAAQRPEPTALEIVVGTESGDWPIDELKAALSVSLGSDVEQFIRKMICHQLFRRRP